MDAIEPVLATAWIAARTAVLITTATAWGAFAPPAWVRLMLVIGATAALAPGAAPPESERALLELGSCALVGGISAMIVAGARYAGELIAFEAGFLPSVWLTGEDDSEDDSVGTPLGLMFSGLAVAVFFLLDGPLAWMDVLWTSLHETPASWGDLSADFASWMGVGLELSVRMAGPIVAALVVAGVALALIGRVGGDVSALGAGMPIRAGLALVLLALAAPGLVDLLQHCWDATSP